MKSMCLFLLGFLAWAAIPQQQSDLAMPADIYAYLQDKLALSLCRSLRVRDVESERNLYDHQNQAELGAIESASAKRM